MLRGALQPSIARRLSVSLTLACLLVWVALYLTGRIGVFAPEVGNFDRELRVIAEAARGVAEQYSDPRDVAIGLGGLAAAIDANRAVQGLHDEYYAFRVIDRDGNVVRLGGKGPRDWPPADDRVGFRTFGTEENPYRIFRTRSSNGRFMIDASSSGTSRRLAYDAVMFSAGALQPLLLGIPLLLLPMWLAVHSGLSPLRRLITELAVRSPEDLAPIRVKAVYRELTPLVAELNGAFSRIGSLLSRERQFLADAAHELRTPLAVMVAQCDTLRHARSDSARAAALKRLDSGLLRGGRVVSQLLALARLEAEVGHEAVDADLADLVRDYLAAHANAAHASGIELSYHGPDRMVLRCSIHAVESIVDNLVGNAVRYGRPGGHVEVCLVPLANHGVELLVRDDGPGISDDQRPHIFERFRRGTAAGVSGSGLGLAIVKSAARQLHAQVDLQPGLDGRGITFRLVWRSDRAPA